MDRVKIVLPNKVLYQTELKIASSDINYGAHLANDKVLAKCSDLRLEFLMQHQLNEIEVGGCGIIMLDASIQFKAEGKFGDVLISNLYVDDITKKSFKFKYSFVRKSDEKTIALVQTSMMFFDYKTRKIATAPDSFLAILK